MEKKQKLDYEEIKKKTLEQLRSGKSLYCTIERRHI